MSLEVRFVYIQVVKDGNKKIYYFKEKPNSRLKDKFMYLYHLSEANKTGIAIYSFPELTLLKANEMYLDFYDLPYNSWDTAYGKQLKVKFH
ncbi:hypothetical protein [Clostridium beijerinckii]|uniref:hypothetical protein n=1 Tax=Clostridium beijerinckii TaxID=1520 RepID=UPI001A9A67A5|nr:hypothetical protein [Clostridium beijerinckii]